MATILVLDDDEILLESCDFSRRVLTCKVARRDDAYAANAIETFWYWERTPTGEREETFIGCRRKC
jgi:hypothetical protein